MNRLPSSKNRTSQLLLILLALATLGAYWPAWAGVFRPEWGDGFTAYDDPPYVSTNDHVKTGLGLGNASWAFTSVECSNWHPLTWLSLQLDSEVFGTEPWGYHLTNVLLHVGNTLLLFAMLRRMTGATWRSMILAGLFALHPLHVESVAWIAERKDVLSTFFGFAALLAYARYAEQPSLARYALTLLLFALSLLSKPMLVTLPFLLLLLDFWPLKRFAWAARQLPSSKADPRFPVQSIRRLLEEKLPFLMSTIVSSVVTYAVQEETAMSSLSRSSLSSRIANALVGYVVYIRKMFWPVDLSIFYPRARFLPGWQVAAAGSVLAAMTIVAVWQARRRPYFAVGWFWYLGTLVPVIGLVQVGGQALADRYTYVPLVGLFVAVSWGLVDLASAFHIPWWLASRECVALLIVCSILTWFQAGYWKDERTVWEHAVKVDPGNDDAESHLGHEAYHRGDLDEALAHYKRAVEVGPEVSRWHNNLAMVLMQKGKWQEAIEEGEKAIECDPNFAVPRENLGMLLMKRGDVAGAIPQFEKVTRLRQNSDRAYLDLGTAYSLAGRWEEAREAFQRAIAIRPSDPRYWVGLAHVEKALGHVQAADSQYRQVLQKVPRWAESANQTAWTMATGPSDTLRSGALALYYAEQLCEATHNENADYLDTLAAALAESGRFDEAVTTLHRAITFVPADHSDRVEAMRSRLKRYEARQPFRDVPGKSHKWEKSKPTGDG